MAATPCAANVIAVAKDRAETTLRRANLILGLSVSISISIQSVEVLAKLTGSEATDHAAEKAPFKASKLVNWAEGVEREAEEEQHDAGVA